MCNDTAYDLFQFRGLIKCRQFTYKILFSTTQFCITQDAYSHIFENTLWCVLNKDKLYVRKKTKKTKVPLLAAVSENQSKPLCFHVKMSVSAVFLHMLLLDLIATEFGPN